MKGRVLEKKITFEESQFNLFLDYVKKYTTMMNEARQKMVELSEQRGPEYDKAEQTYLSCLDIVRTNSKFCATYLFQMYKNNQVDMDSIINDFSIDVTGEFPVFTALGQKDIHHAKSKLDLEKHDKCFATNNGHMVVYSNGRAYHVPCLLGISRQYLKEQGFKDEGSNLGVPFSNGETPVDSELTAQLLVSSELGHISCDYFEFMTKQEETENKEKQ